jgi:hypothetical protein
MHVQFHSLTQQINSSPLTFDEAAGFLNNPLSLTPQPDFSKTQAFANTSRKHLNSLTAPRA